MTPRTPRTATARLGGRIVAAVAAHLQGVAWEAGQAFHAREGRGSL